MTVSDLQARVAKSRADLETTLDAIEDKLNVPKQVGELTRKAQASYEKNPLPWIAGATAIAIGIVGLVTWALLSDD